ncbi:porin [Bartonella senegalensis]|uniref:porin n=1 Tax=Bartonella senegalensis TaxID=1468418 RepID=UPI0002D6A235|nr:porin [Bartonella senegalensis]
MNIKSLMTTSVIALISASAAQAADVVVPHEVAPAAIVAPTFSWTGFYIGGQVGNFSSKVKITDPETKNKLFSKDETPQPSGFMGGIYAGSNIDLGSGLILGVETDAVWADRGETKVISVLNESGNQGGGSGGQTQGGGSGGQTQGTDAGSQAQGTDTGSQAQGTDTGSQKSFSIATIAVGDGAPKHSFTLKEKWSGATRVRIGFAAADRIMPYIAGGIAYAQMQGIVTVSGSDKKETDKTKTFVGFTVGGGVDFAMTDNVLLRAEYRYSDFGKKQFVKDGVEFNYKTNDFRVGVAYKF